MPGPVRRVRISPKRQITIPKEFYDKLDMRSNRAKIFLEGNRLIVEPLKSDDDFFDFTAEILADLKKRGYSGQALLDEVNRRKQQIDAALAEMVQEALEEYRRGESLSHDEVFKLEDDR